MPLVKIFYPQTVVDFIEIEVDHNQLEQMKGMTNLEKADFTARHLDERSLQNIPGTLEAAFEYDYARFFYY